MRGNYLLLPFLLLAGCAEADNSSESLLASAFEGYPSDITGRSFYVGVLSPEARPGDVEMAARELCGSATHCKVLGWYRADAVPARLMMTDREAQAEAFNYFLNRTNGEERALWICENYAGPGVCPEE